MKIIFEPNKSKVSQLVDTFRLAISKGVYRDGDPIPSIRKISVEYGLSRDTVYKAFHELKEKGIIESIPTKGYFVTNTVNNVFVLLDIFSPYKEDLYNELTAKLPVNYKADLHFHHYNKRSFNNLILDSIGRYDLYVITNLHNDIYSDVLDRLDKSKILLLDLGKFKKDKFSYVCQGFDSTLYDCLRSGLDQIKKYGEICFVLNEESEHPKSSILYFEQFCKDNSLKYNVLTRNITDADIQPNTVYLAARHKDMISIVKICKDKGLTLGKAVGLITFNDAPMLEVIEGGISTISTDFKEMGSLAAEFIKTRARVQTYVPTKLILRNSL